MAGLWRLLTAAVAGLALVAGAACSSGSSGGTATESPAATESGDGSGATATPAARDTPRPTTGDLSTADLVRLAEPSVVRIAVGGGVGSGFVVSEDGYIITNNHVVASSGRPTAGIEVTTSDGAVHSARLIGGDPRSDLALIKIEATGLRALKLGSLAETVVGQDVVAIGYALDLARGEGPSFSVTRGIVSAKNRGIDEASTILGAIQTDAAINHGNSGGPLLNLHGEVVGVNTAIAPDRTTGGIAPGIGFAVGVDTVKAVLSELRESGRVDRGLLGILNFEALRPAKAKELGVPVELGGVYLSTGTITTAAAAAQRSVDPNGPAGRAGIQPGDVITRIGAFTIRNESDLVVALIRHQPNDAVEVEIYRDGKKMSVTVTLGAASAS
ncbi:MAG: S1C family serine protease [Tepidiformaceae bacterium]